MGGGDPLGHELSPPSLSGVGREGKGTHTIQQGRWGAGRWKLALMRLSGSSPLHLSSHGSGAREGTGPTRGGGEEKLAQPEEPFPRVQQGVPATHPGPFSHQDDPVAHLQRSFTVGGPPICNPGDEDALQSKGWITEDPR